MYVCRWCMPFRDVSVLTLITGRVHVFTGQTVDRWVEICGKTDLDRNADDETKAVEDNRDPSITYRSSRDNPKRTWNGSSHDEQKPEHQGGDGVAPHRGVRVSRRVCAASSKVI